MSEFRGTKTHQWNGCEFSMFYKAEPALGHVKLWFGYDDAENLPIFWNCNLTVNAAILSVDGNILDQGNDS